MFGNMSDFELPPGFSEARAHSLQEKTARRITNRFLKNNGQDLPTAFSVRGGLLGIMQTSHEPEVYAQVDDMLVKKDIAVYRVPGENKDYMGLLATRGTECVSEPAGLPEGAVQIYPPVESELELSTD